MRGKIISVMLGVGLLFSLMLLAGRFGSARLPADQQGYEPVQPVAYSHRLHAGELQIQCLYCHFGAAQSRHAGIPSGSICLNCHTQVRSSFGAVRQEDEVATREKRSPRAVVSSEIGKLYTELGLDTATLPSAAAITKSIAWTRVHRLPDFVYFDHRAHVTVGVTCQTCHGPVETMERMRQFSSLSMGWCVNCHRDAAERGINGKRVNASTDCATCHY